LTCSSQAPILFHNFSSTPHTSNTPADGLLEGPTADTCEKGGRFMSNSPFFPYREEVERYLRSCEDLLAAATTSPFSKEERAMMGYYVAEIQNLLANSLQK
jgi:hypothetical protein